MEDKEVEPKNTSRRRRMRIVMLLVLVIVCAAGSRLLWHSYYFEETNNAYVAGHVSAVSTRIPGIAVKILVADNQEVEAGDILAELDSTDQGVKIEQIKAQIAQLEAQGNQVDAQISQAKAEADVIVSQIARAQAQKKRTGSEASRYVSLYNEDVKAVSKNELDLAVAANESASADVRAMSDRERAARSNISASMYSRVVLREQRKVLGAQLKNAMIQMGYHRILAPVSGRVGRKAIEVGDRVQPGQQLLAIVQNEKWITANFKETQLTGLYPGQKAIVRIDAFPGKEFVGEIDSLSPASGAQFSLLPPDNATGNFTKIVQRVPVKVVFDADSLGRVVDRISPGMSVSVEVDLRQGNPAETRKPQSVATIQ